jgi:hypothetical protein
MKPDNKLGKLHFDPMQAIENLRTKARKVLVLSKEEIDRRVATERLRKRRSKS